MMQELWTLYWDYLLLLLTPFVYSEAGVIFLATIFSYLVIFAIYTGYDRHLLGGFSGSTLRRSELTPVSFLLLLPQLIITMVSIIEKTPSAVRPMFLQLGKYVLSFLATRFLPYAIAVIVGFEIGAQILFLGFWPASYFSVSFLSYGILFSGFGVFVLPVYIRFFGGRLRWIYLVTFLSAILFAVFSLAIQDLNLTEAVQLETQRINSTATPTLNALNFLASLLFTGAILTIVLSGFIIFGREIAKISLQNKLLTRVDRIVSIQPIPYFNKWPQCFSFASMSQNKDDRFLSRLVGGSIPVSVEPSAYVYAFDNSNDVDCYLLESYNQTILFYLQQKSEDALMGGVVVINKDMLQSFDTSEKTIVSKDQL